MSCLEAYNSKIIKYDLVNTFVYQNLTQMPRLEKMILNFGYPKSKLKNLISGLLALEFLSAKKGQITKSRHLNIFLKIKKDFLIVLDIIFVRIQILHNVIKVIQF